MSSKPYLRNQDRVYARRLNVYARGVEEIGIFCRKPEESGVM